MKINNIKSIILGILVIFLAGCIEEKLPTSYATADQIGGSEIALEAVANSTAAFMYDYAYIGGTTSQEFGYTAMMVIRDAMTDAPYVATRYNHFNTPWANLDDFTRSRAKQPWRYYYRMILNANNTILAVGDPDEHGEKIQQFYGNALIYRALSYMDLARMYEYKKTGVAQLDNEAEQNGVYGLTAVIIDENFDPVNVENNPRVPFYHMYRFIMDDLNKAEKYLDGYVRPSKIRGDVSVVHAMKARMWLEMATRFQKHPADLQEQISNENNEELAHLDQLGISNANDCYAKAAEYARKVIDGPYSPLTKEQWHSTTDGFNNMNSQNSWLFAISISSMDAVHNRLNNLHGNANTEYSRGYSRSQYHCYRMIDKRLYDRVQDGDWRKVTWIDPADQGKIPTPDKYYTNLGKLDAANDDPIGTEWALRDAYVGFKYRTNGGSATGEDYKQELQVDYPIMRVEEMYFIEAEAKAFTNGLAAGVSLLETFMNNHRFEEGTFSVDADDVNDFVDQHLLPQKRIEFWGEGHNYFDMKRRELAIERGYPGTNWQDLIRYNSVRAAGNVPSWFNFYVPNEGEASLNKAIIMNPNPLVYDVYDLWVGN